MSYLGTNELNAHSNMVIEKIHQVKYNWNITIV